VPHDSTLIPADDTVIWRYMKLNSFLELLSGHFVQTRIDMLHDPREGAYGWKDIRFAPVVLEKLHVNGASRSAGDHAAAEIIRQARKHAAATYWFEFDAESYGMWNVYGRAGESVAVETTVAALRSVLARQGEVHIERMRYEPMKGDIADVHTLFFHKQREYKDEREIRSVQIFSEPLEEPVLDQQLSIDDLNGLMRRIILAPDSRGTFTDAVKRIVESVFARERAEYTGEICASALDEDLVP
jgi:hypothetical protein